MARKILILEDDALLRKQLGRLFTGRGYEVHSTASVSAFVAAAGRERFDACLFDLSLPDGSGLDAWIAAGTGQPRATAVLLTAHGTAEVTNRAAELGVSVLAKPVDILTLVAAVRGDPK